MLLAHVAALEDGPPRASARERLEAELDPELAGRLVRALARRVDRRLALRLADASAQSRNGDALHS